MLNHHICFYVRNACTSYERVKKIRHQKCLSGPHQKINHISNTIPVKKINIDGKNRHNMFLYLVFGVHILLWWPGTIF